MLHSPVESAAIEVSGDENISKEYEAISARMIGLVDEYKFKFDNLSWEIPDPEQTLNKTKLVL